MSWARLVLLLCNTFKPLAVSGLRVLSLLHLKLSPLSHPPELPLTLAGGLPRVTLRTPPRLISPTFRFQVWRPPPPTPVHVADTSHHVACRITFSFEAMRFIFGGVDLSGHCTL
jgi:hypothetical protein